jgi:hypothetical protein
MPRNLIAPEPWWPHAADLMVRYDRSLLEAAAKLKMRQQLRGRLKVLRL